MELGFNYLLRGVIVNSFEIGAFLENFRAIKQSSSQHTIFFGGVHSNKTRKSKMAVPGFFFQDRAWVI